MKPKNIILIRHGQSQGNVDKTIYARIPDYALKLTDKGRQEALDAGKEIAKVISGKTMVYCSSYHRTRQTYEGVKKSLDVWKYYETPLLREQEWGTTFDGIKSYQDASEDIEKYRDEHGTFYYRFKSGESVADVFGRVSQFLDTLFRDFEKPDFPENVVIVTHGMTWRVLLMRWFHLTIEEFELLKNPKNCEFCLLTSDDRNGKYKLATPLKKWDQSVNKFKFEWEV